MNNTTIFRVMRIPTTTYKCPILCRFLLMELDVDPSCLQATQLEEASLSRCSPQEGCEFDKEPSKSEIIHKLALVIVLRQLISNPMLRIS